MYSLDELKKMTVAQLRKYAKEQGIELSAGLNKQQMVETIHNAQPEREETTQSLATAAVRPAVRQALIISDDSDDIPVMTVNATPRTPVAPPPVRPSVSIPRPTPPPPKGNKPAFTLQGARAWHNPQPYAAVPAPNKFQSQQTQPINMVLSNQQGMTDAAPVVRTSLYTRFGPDVPAQPQETPAVPPVQQRVYRAGAATMQDEPVPATPRTREIVGSLQAVPEMMAAGDCGEGEGVLEVHPDGYGFLRTGNFLPGRDDVYVSNAQIRRFSLRTGDYVKGKTRPQREMDKYSAMLYITAINGEDVDERAPRREFERLTPIYPQKKIKLSNREHSDMDLRVIDLFAPIGFGQRALAMLPFGADRAAFYKKILSSVKDNYPEVHRLLLLVNERPEEVTAIQGAVDCEVRYATFDEPPENNARVCDMVIERAKRLAECGQDVLVVLNDLSALSRAYKGMSNEESYEKNCLSGAGALGRAKKLLGAARCLKEGGSITVVAVLQGADESTVAKAIAEELHCVMTETLVFDEHLINSVALSPISLSRSITVKGDALLTSDEADMMGKLRPLVSQKTDEEAMALLMSIMEKTTTNRELTSRFDTWMAFLKEDNA